MKGFIVVSLTAAVVILALAAFLWAVPVKAGECITGSVSWYGKQHHGRLTASGARFNQWGHTAAMANRKHLGEVWHVYYGKRSVEVVVDDTGGFAKYGRMMDLSRGAFRALASEGAGVLPVKACRLR